MGHPPYSLLLPPPPLDKVKPCKKRASFFVYEFFLDYIKKAVMAFSYRIQKNSFIMIFFFTSTIISRRIRFRTIVLARLSKHNCMIERSVSCFMGNFFLEFVGFMIYTWGGREKNIDSPCVTEQPPADKINLHLEDPPIKSWNPPH